MRIASTVDTMPIQGSKPLENDVTTIKQNQNAQNHNKRSAQESVQQKNEDAKKDLEREVINAIERANEEIRTYDRRLEFSIHEETKEIMVKVIDTADDTVIREIPSEKILDMIAKMVEMAGILVDERR
ncbi:flagellar protein FlaG [Natranaerovirga hydrolytica]|uniref:Flagellar protein FlaG n=1 Tax=Natranaerovirga hydrolytica TaxID=680378 RepID=A0A4R1MN83_9FIRM|nr:flagellar protein FlaG [Natranaerovirga hydrolytica]TCK93392.1 flagellar protein FlaG [Natranaerovirga hydrolytica]